ncbi:hypothetical protein GCM10007967_31480 [Xylanimonas ulmi]
MNEFKWCGYMASVQQRGCVPDFSDGNFIRSVGSPRSLLAQSRHIVASDLWRTVSSDDGAGTGPGPALEVHR